jgi:hypothetical protein
MTKPSGRGRHSYIQFYPSDWLAGVGHLPRPVRSIYFDICLYTWDKVRPVPATTLKVMCSDVDNGLAMVDFLVEEGKLLRDESGAVHSPRAMAEAQRSFDAWEAKSIGGRGGRATVKEESSEHSSQDSSKHLPIEPEPEPEPEPDRKVRKEEDSSISQLELNDETAPLLIVQAWNTMAKGCKLSQAVRLTEERSKRLKARIEEHGAEAILGGIKVIPDSPFLIGKGDRGWKANFDWLLKPEACAKLVEGTYHNEGEGEGPWTS